MAELDILTKLGLKIEDYQDHTGQKPTKILFGQHINGELTDFISHNLAKKRELIFQHPMKEV